MSNRRALKVYAVNAQAYAPDRELLKAPGCRQLRAIVQTNSQKNAALMLDVTVGHLRQYGYCDTQADADLRAVAQHPPGTVLIRPLDDHDAEYQPRQVIR